MDFDLVLAHLIERREMLTPLNSDRYHTELTLAVWQKELLKVGQRIVRVSPRVVRRKNWSPEEAAEKEARRRECLYWIEYINEKIGDMPEVDPEYYEVLDEIERVKKEKAEYELQQKLQSGPLTYRPFAALASRAA